MDEASRTPRECSKWVHDYQGWGHCIVFREQESIVADDPICINCPEFIEVAS